jgi:hypothetical protein
MQRFEPEPRAEMPPDFEGWIAELLLLADAEGEAATLGILLQYAPLECVSFLATVPALCAELISRARYADRCRFEFGVYAGRRLRA